MRPTVLHVTEALGGGIISACVEMAAAASDFRHELLFTRRGDFDTGDLDGGSFSATTEVAGRAALVGALLRRTRREPPAVVHLHSAWAGLLGRLLPIPRRRVVYSPHSFYFDRVDAPTAVRLAARTVERALALRTGQIVAVGPREHSDASRFHTRSVLVPNVVRLTGLPPEQRPAPEEPAGILAIGRLAPQKDPQFFAEVVRRLRESCARPFSATWIGAGDPALHDVLTGAGVDVLGWVPRPDVLTSLRRCSVYVHTAAWEGNPMSVLEAVACGTPVVGRSIPALTALGFPDGLDSPDAVAARVAQVLAGGPGDRGTIDHARAEAEQRRALTAAYAWAAGPA